MSSPYKFGYAEVSVYACAVRLITRYATPGTVHVDLGCGYAAIAGKLQTAGLRYIGFDANSEVVKELRANGIEAHTIDLLQAEQAVAAIREACAGVRISTLSMLDVIEHLDFECQLLRVLREQLPGADTLTLIASIPNFSHSDVAIKLLAGQWEYTTSGLLDNTHRVIYTERHLTQTLQQAGWQEIDCDDYHQEYSDQALLHPTVVLNRTAGIGKHLRQLKGILDPYADVHQFVRAYRVQTGVQTTALQPSRILTVLVHDEAGLAWLCEELETACHEACRASMEVALVAPLADSAIQHLQALAPELLVVGDGKQKRLAADWRQFSGHYCLNLAVPLPLHGYLGALLSVLGDGGEVAVLYAVSPQTCAERSSLSLEQLDTVLTAPPANVLIPLDYVRQFRDLPTDWGNDAAWQAYVGRASLCAGVRCVMLPENVLPQPIPVLPLLSPLKLDVTPDMSVLEGIALLGYYQQQHVVMRQRHSDLEAHLQAMQASLSWRITKPVRFAKRIPQLTRKWAAMNWLAFATWRLLFRTLVAHIPGLRVVRQQYLHWKFQLLASETALWNSRDNLPALQALSAHRFEPQTLMGEIPEQYPLLDVSVVSFNSTCWVQPFLSSLQAQAYPLARIHLRVVDHGSQDDTVVQFERWFAQQGRQFAGVELIQQANLGFGAGHDRAIRAGTAEFCLVTNLDMEFLPDTLTTLVRAALADTQRRVASWEVRQIPFEHPKYYDPVTLETHWSSHACILLRRSAYQQVGGYDPQIFMYAEDVELSYRLRSYGYVLKYVPQAVVKHFTYETAGQVKPLQFTGSALGNVAIRLRYGNWLDRLLALPLYGALLLRPEAFAGAKSWLLKQGWAFLPKILHFIRGKGSAAAGFPLRRFDYELTREGAFWEVTEPRPASDVPLVSIITRTYRGRVTLLQQAIQSVFNQTYPNIELLVVEDGGDTQQALVDSLLVPAHCQVRFIACEKLGRSGAGNAALSAARGEYVMFLDDDDLLFADHVETLLAVLCKDPDLAAAYALAFEVLTDMNADLSGYRENAFHTPAIFRQEWDHAVMVDHNFIPIQAIIFKRALYLERGGFDVTLDQLEDWNLWIRYGYGKRFAYVPKTTSLFRSPADFAVRADRHALLHEAYELAKVRALKAIAVGWGAIPR